MSDHATTTTTTAQAAAPKGVSPASSDEKEAVALLERMREVSRTRELGRAQSEVVALALCNYNLLLRGPVNSGKRYIARRAGDLIAMRQQKPEIVEIMSKWFTVTAQGQINIDEGSLKIGIEQIQRATVLIIESVPCHPQAAAAFFAHLDFICKVERAKLGRKDPSASSPPGQASFGGIQIIATQNEATEDEPQPSPQVLWTTKYTAPPPQSAGAFASASSSSQGAGPPQTAQQMGLLVTTASPVANNPHPDVFVILFR